jgi:glycosyltransferase involved in cell wall biosynthesis
VIASIIIASYGDDHYRRLAEQRAYPSAITQGCEVILHHDEGTKIHEARNNAAARASGEWLCFLDADDELEPGYMDAMMQSSGDLRYPKVRYVMRQTEPLRPAVELRKRHLLEGNYMVIGTMLRRELFNRVGGFDEFRSWEDWCLWIKCWMAGAESQLCPNAVYRSYVNPTGRCIVSDPAQLHAEIVNHYKSTARAS